MARGNIPLFAFNRGLVSPKSLARVDLERTRLSAETFNNWLPKTQGSMTLRPGTKYFGSSRHDTGATFIEFVAATDDVALPELTDGTMRIWLGDDGHNLALLERPAVETTVSLSDTGWSSASAGGVIAGVSGGTVDYVPAMTAATTNGVTVAAKSEGTSVTHPAWMGADNSTATSWQSSSGVPQWWRVDFGAGNTRRIKSYTVRAGPASADVKSAPKAWTLEGNDVDTGNGWTVEDTRSAQTGWAVSEKRTFSNASYTDTGANAWRYWRLNISAVSVAIPDKVIVSEFELQNDTGGSGTAADLVRFDSQGLTLNADSIGALARARRQVVVDTGDYGVEHSVAITVSRGPVTLRVGSSSGDDDFVRETQLGTGYHSLAFVPEQNFHITVQSDTDLDRIVSSIEIGAAGVVEIPAPWGADDLDNIRYDQSADVVYVDCAGIRPRKVERRGTGRSWSLVNYEPDDGPFLATSSSSAKLDVSQRFGNTTLTSDIPYFTASHIGALFRLFHEGQNGRWFLGNVGAKTDAIQVAGISDTGAETGSSERTITFTVTGTWAGTMQIERSIDGDDLGFAPLSANLAKASSYTGDTGTFTRSINDQDDNLKVWYRARISSYVSGVAQVVITYKGGGVTGICRVTDYVSNQTVAVEVLKRFSDTGPSDNWQEGYWSDNRGFPTATVLHGGRLAHAQGGSLFLSVSDDYESFDEDVEGDAGPIIRTFGSGPVDNINFMVSLLRLIVGTSGSEISIRSSSLDEPLTPDNTSTSDISTLGSAPLRAIKMDTRAIMIQRSRQRAFMIGPSQNAVADYEAFELTLLVPDLLEAGVVSVAIQRQPDTRLHCVMADGTVKILTYEPAEDVVCWSTWSTDGVVERAMVLPGVGEDAVYYHIKREMAARGLDDDTVLLLHMDGNGNDASASRLVFTAHGNAKFNDDVAPKFGAAALVCDGTGDYLSHADDDVFTLGSGDWTIDCWFNRQGGDGTERYICGQVDGGGTLTNSSIGIFLTTGNAVQVSASTNVTTYAVTGTTTFTAAGWHHVAFVRTGNVLKLFVDGVQEGVDVAVSGTVNDSSSAFSIGRRGEVTIKTWNGLIDEFRISTVARWTSNFTPQSYAYAPATVRYLEKWAMESECVGDTGLTWLADCAKSYTDTGRTTALTGFQHLIGKNIILWADDTGSVGHGKDLSPDAAGVQTTYAVDTGSGAVTLSEAVHHAVGGLPYAADWRSAKLAYAAEAGTALTQMKRVDKMGVILHQTHNNGLFFGSDSGHLDALPRMDKGAVVDADAIHPVFDQVAFPFPSAWDADARVHLRAKAPRPATVLAIVPTVATNEKV